MKKNIVVMFGGKSSEYEVSLMSAESIINNLDKNKYNIICIGITRDGRWLTGRDVFKKFKDGLKNKHDLSEIILDPNRNKFINAETEKQIKIDVIFPIFHGPYGEDGSMQGVFEIMNLPYVGAKVLGSAIGLDKVIQKQILESAGVPVVKYGWIQSGKFFTDGGKKNENLNLEKIVRHIGLPCFVKPVNAGSSVGVTKVKELQDLAMAIDSAKKYDKKVIIEKAVGNLKELECSVLGNESPRASVAGEIVPGNEFYDYEAKYFDENSRLIIPAKINKKLLSQIKDLAIKAYKLLNCFGMARVDFLYDSKNNKLYLNEINTIPGFTQISMYPKLWEASGINYKDLLDELINLAQEENMRC